MQLQDAKRAQNGNRHSRAKDSWNFHGVLDIRAVSEQVSAGVSPSRATCEVPGAGVIVDTHMCVHALALR